MATVTFQPASCKTIVAELYGDRDETPVTSDRQLYRETVASVAERAKAAMEPAVHGRIDKAQALVLAGDVTLLPDGTAQVASQSNGASQYVVVNGTCPCKDFSQALEGWCKHRLAAAIATRVQQALTLADAQDETPVAAETSEMALLAPYVVTIQGKAFVRYAGLLALAHARGLASLEATFISVTDALALAQATATFTDGRHFVECGDATPSNVGRQVAPHFARMALTRAKARCLRDALNVNMVAVEELD